MRKSKLLFFLLFITTNCFSDSGWNEGFLKMAHTFPYVAVVRIATAIQETIKKQDVIEIEVIEVLKGNIKPRYIMLQKGNMSNFFYSFSEFSIGEFWVFVMVEDYYSSFKYEFKTYGVPMCGETYLKIKNDSVKGYITENSLCTKNVEDEMSVSNLKMAIKKPYKFILPTKSCENNYYIDIEHTPRFDISQQKICDFFFQKN